MKISSKRPASAVADHGRVAVAGGGGAAAGTTVAAAVTASAPAAAVARAAAVATAPVATPPAATACVGAACAAVPGPRAGSRAAASVLAAAAAAAAASAVLAADAADPPAASAAAEAATAFAPPVDGPRLGAGWRFVGWPQQKPPRTRYRAEVPADAPAPAPTVLRIEADASYGNLVLPLAGVAAPQRLAWSWRVLEPNARANLADKAGDDAPAKVCLAFDLPLDRVPFVERQLLRMARSRSADPLPAATLCWVWGSGEPAGTRVDNPYSRRVRQIVLRGAADADGRWSAEQVDVAADFRRTFGDESATLPPVVAVIVAGDADNTGARSVAQVAALRWLP